MSTYWRISNYADLQGIGGTKVAGRWHNRGIPIVYFADSQALALLETLVHIEDMNDVPDSYQLLKVEYKESHWVNISHHELTQSC